MKAHRMALIGVGATGSVLAAALLSNYPETVIVGRKPHTGDVLGDKGLRISGALTYRTAVKNYITRIAALKEFHPTLIFLATKTFHLGDILPELKQVYEPGTTIIATQNGLGVEDFLIDNLDPADVLRMSLNFGAAMKSPGQVEVAFFNAPNHLGGFKQEHRDLGFQIAQMLTDCGLATDYVEDIKLFVWKKMVMKCTMAPICAVTNKTIKEALEFAPTKEIADACFKEALAVARAEGYDIGEDYLEQAVKYLMKAGVHRDSMCHDIASKKPTEIDYLGAKIVEYGKANYIPTPFYVAMTNLVKAIEDGY
ncbi:MAG: 2-dehydropantoate 2-reductase [Desulfobacterales bacterium]